MIEIIPAVLPKNYEDLKSKVASIRGLVKIVQVDICDGTFVKTLSWPFLSRSESGEFDLDPYVKEILEERAGMPFWEEIDYEFDLMVSHAKDNFDLFLKLGAKRMIFHAEAEGDIEELAHFIEGIDLYVRENVEIGIAINTTTPISDIKILISHVDFVQCMGIERIGFQGEPFDERVIDQIKSLKKEYPELTVTVDGGVNFDTASSLIEAGADRLVAGSAIWNSLDIREAIRELEDIN